MELSFRRNSTERSLIEGENLTTKPPLTPEEEDAIVTLVVVVLGIIIAIVGLFSMGVFIDCRQQKQDSMTKRKRLNLKMPPLSRRRNNEEDEKSLAPNMYQGVSDFGAMRITGDAVV